MPDVDRLTIVSHDRFQEIMDHANDPNSIIRTGMVIGRDIPDKPTQAMTIPPTLLLHARHRSPPEASAGTPRSRRQQPLFTTERERRVAEATLHVIQQDFERLKRSGDLKDARSAAEACSHGAGCDPPGTGGTGRCG